MLRDLKRIALEACVLIAFAALFGLTLNHQLVMDAFSGRVVSPQSTIEEVNSPAALPMPVLIDEVQQVMASGGLIVDARSPELYALEHIEGAVSLPMVDRDKIATVIKLTVDGRALDIEPKSLVVESKRRDK